MKTVECEKIEPRYAGIPTLCKVFDIGATKCREIVNAMRTSREYSRDVVVTGRKIWVMIDSFEAAFRAQDIRKIRRRV